MKKDPSRQFYEYYFSQSKRQIAVQLTEGKTFTGEFISFFLGDVDRNEPYVLRWNLVDELLLKTMGKVSFEPHIGELINQNDIESITFLSDNKKFIFN